MTKAIVLPEFGMPSKNSIPLRIFGALYHFQYSVISPNIKRTITTKIQTRLSDK